MNKSFRMFISYTVAVSGFSEIPRNIKACACPEKPNFGHSTRSFSNVHVCLKKHGLGNHKV